MGTPNAQQVLMDDSDTVLDLSIRRSARRVVTSSASQAVPFNQPISNIQLRSEVKKMYPCDICSVRFYKHTELIHHQEYCRIHSKSQERYQAMLQRLEEIERESMTLDNKGFCFCCLEDYENYHKGHFKCKQCSFSFNTYMGHERHVFINHAEHSRFPCTECSANLRSAKFLELHKLQHEKQGKVFVCKTCGQGYTKMYNLKRHERSCLPLTELPPYKCDECPAIVNTMVEYRRHKNKHTAAFDLECKLCGKISASHASLMLHQRLHYGEKPFQCDFCSKSFADKELLKKHLRYHTGEKPYSCHLCSGAFVGKEDLNRHLKVHAGEKQHTCKLCGKKYLRPSILRTHVTIHHHRPIPCTLCYETFKTKQAMMRHLKPAHKLGKRAFLCTICAGEVAQPLSHHHDRGITHTPSSESSDDGVAQEMQEETRHDVSNLPHEEMNNQ